MDKTTENNKKTTLSKTNQLRDVIVFVVIMLAANILWKICFRGDDLHREIMLFGVWDVEILFQWAIDSTAYLSTKLLNLLGMGAELMSNNVVRFANGNGAEIIWGCTAIKQSFIFMAIILCSKGFIKDKILFIGAGFAVIYILNVLRISTILGVMKYHPEMFDLVHGVILKYLFYICIFLMWVLWEEKFACKKEKQK